MLLSRGIYRKRCPENILQVYRRTAMPKCGFNKVAKQLYWNHTRHGCSPVNLLHISRATFYKSIYGGLLVNWCCQQNTRETYCFCSQKELIYLSSTLVKFRISSLHQIQSQSPEDVLSKRYSGKFHKIQKIKELYRNK